MDLIKVSLTEKWDIILTVSAAVWILCALLAIYVVNKKYISTFLSKRGEFVISEAELGIGSQKIKIVPNLIDSQIAYEIWVELCTRKLGLEFDKENDVVIEVYNSWYEFFKITRELIKKIPISKLRNDSSSKKIVEISVKVLNEVLRPHLTKWQAKYRKWYTMEMEKDDCKDLTPQEIQMRYPMYKELCDDILDVNNKIIKYKDMLDELIRFYNK